MGVAAKVSGGRALAHSKPLAEAAGGERTRTGGCKYIWSDFDGSRRAGGSNPPTPTPTHDSGRLATTPSLPATWVGADGAQRLDILGLVPGDRPPPADSLWRLPGVVGRSSHGG